MRLTLIHIALIAIFLFYGVIALAQKPQAAAPPYPDAAEGVSLGSRNADREKLSPELRMLLTQYRTGSRGGEMTPRFDAATLRQVFGIRDAEDDDPEISVAVKAGTAASDALKQAGLRIFLRQNGTIYGRIPVLSLAELAGVRAVTSIAAIKSARMPELPMGANFAAPPAAMAAARATASRSTTPANSEPPAGGFDRRGLRGRGVIVGIIDSGIDFRHAAFLKPDGTSRIIAIWDMLDDSFKTSGGRVGTSPPRFEDDGEPLMGTVYTKAQIDAALKGTGTVNTVDNHGHGTATAGTAAGGPVGSFTGVAPEADLMIVKAADCGGFIDEYVYGAAWIVEAARAMKRPVVINQSFGGHFTAHDGTEQEELFINELSGRGKRGVVFTVSAGNEGRYSFHAAGQFGPRRPGQQDITSQPVTLNIPAQRSRDGAAIIGTFDSRDDWGAVIKPSGQTMMTDANGRPIFFYVFKSDGELKYLLGDGLEKPDWFDAYARQMLSNSRFGERTDMLVLWLPHGQYHIWGFAASGKVTSGSFDLYLPNYSAGDFGMGTVKAGMVGSPGNASSAITVGAYNFRRNWKNSEGTETMFGFALNDISDYSSPGGRRRDGVVKPDIAAPGTYAISPMSRSSAPGSQACDGQSMGASLGKRFVTSDGAHVAWSGTSASSPFVAGVAALMLQKNPNLDADQIRQILVRTARKGGSVGGVPNPAWGNGMIDPSAALLATPAAAPARRR